MLDGEGSSIHRIITEYFGRSNTSLIKHKENKFISSAIQPTAMTADRRESDTGSGTSLDLSWLAASRALQGAKFPSRARANCCHFPNAGTREMASLGMVPCNKLHF